MRKRLSKAMMGLIALLAMVGILALAWGQWSSSTAATVSTKQKTSQTVTHKPASQTANKSQQTKSEPDPKLPKQNTDYPDLSQYDDLAIKVSTKQQKMTILSGDNPLFQTTVSTGAPESPTPLGQFVIEPERGDFFFNNASGEGAYYWVSFKGHGIYLFHSLPTDQQGNEIPEEAALLGKKASHGCVRMSRQDAKWFYETIPEGISVTIE